MPQLLQNRRDISVVNMNIVDLQNDFGHPKVAGQKGLVGAISTRASCNPSDGHYFSMYEALTRFQGDANVSVPSTVGRSNNRCSFIDPVLTPSTRGSEFNFTLANLATYRMKKLRSVLLNKKRGHFSTYFLYDGGLVELFLATWLAQKIPEVSFVFNFHWADQWNEILDSKNSLAKFREKTVRQLVQAHTPNLYFSAESEPLAKKIFAKTAVKMNVFPVFSTLDKEETVPWKYRNTDVLILPQRQTELDFTFDLASRLTGQDFHVAIGVKGLDLEPWEDPQGSTGPISVIPFPLSQPDYARVLRSTKVVVLPYDKPYFIWGSSGKFADAIAMGCFPLAPKGTAIPLQARIDPRKYELNLFDVAEAHATVKTALTTGVPQLQPLRIEDFFEWIFSLPEQQHRYFRPNKPPNLTPFVLTLAWCHFLIRAFSFFKKLAETVLRTGFRFFDRLLTPRFFTEKDRAPLTKQR